MKIAVAYARYSSDNQRQESITAQLREIYNYATKNEIKIIKVYTDEAQSATTDERVNFQNMIVELSELSPDFVLVHKLDRFARNKYDAAFYRREIKKVHSRLIAVEQDFGEGPEAELMEGILEGFAEYFSSNLGREIKKGLTENAIQGKHCGGIPPLGYDTDANGKYIINEIEAQAVRLIFKRKLEGRSYKEIQSELNELGYRSKRGKPFAINSLHDILRNEKYIGTFVLRKTSPGNSHKAFNPNKTMRIENAIPPIIDEHIFNLIQEMLDRAKNRPNPNEGSTVRYLLTGILKCGLCNGAMSGDTKSKNGIRRGYYRCGRAKRTKECEHIHRYPKALIEGAVLDEIEKETGSIKNIDAMAARLMKEINKTYGNSSQQKEIQKELHRVEKELTNLTNAIAKGVDPRYISDKLNELGMQKERLTMELKQSGMVMNITKEKIVKYLEKRKQIKFDRNNEDECLLAIRDSVKEAIVFPDETIVNFKGFL